MRLGFVGGTRLDPWDRNSSQVQSTYAASGVAPHADTERWNRSMTSTQKGMVTHAQVHLLRETVATTNGRVQAIIQVAPDGVTYGQSLRADLLTNALGDKGDAILGGSIYLSPSSAIRARTEDLSTGGSILYVIDTEFILFDV